MSVRLGLERLLDGPDSSLIKGQRVGLVCNPASVDSRLVHASDRLAAGAGWTLTTLFGPQHGFRSDLQENMIESPHARDAKRRLHTTIVNLNRFQKRRLIQFEGGGDGQVVVRAGHRRDD